MHKNEVPGATRLRGLLRSQVAKDEDSPSYAVAVVVGTGVCTVDVVGGDLVGAVGVESLPNESSVVEAGQAFDPDAGCSVCRIFYFWGWHFCSPTCG